MYAIPLSFRQTFFPSRFSCVGAAIAIAMLLSGHVGRSDESMPPLPISPQPVEYLNADFPGSQWAFVAGRKEARLSETWSLGEDADTKARILICKGEPHGYLRTVNTFENFRIELDWRFPKDPDGNSGILLFTSGEDRVWPESLQIQFHQPELGTTFPIGGAKSANEIRTVSKLAKPLNQWNRCEIECIRGTVSITINGQPIGVVTGCVPSVGAIGLQSEGSEIHFRAISIREIPVATLDEVPIKASSAARLEIDPR